MASRLLSLSLGVLGLTGLIVTVACGGGSDGGSDSNRVGTPTISSGDSRGLQPDGSSPQAGGPAATSTPTGPAGPEGAVPKVTSRSRNTGGGEEVNGGPSAPGEPTPLLFVTPLDDWDGFGDAFGVDRGNGLVHGGIDFILDGFPKASIYAACDGWVAGILESDTHGKHVIIKCGDTMWTTVYAHLGETFVKVNDTVLAGKTIIARSGGNTAWGHEMLHFELRWDFVPVDPAAHMAFNVRPSFTLPPTPTTDDGALPQETPTSGPGSPGGATPIPGVPTSTPTMTPTPTPTLWYNPTATPTPKAATPTPTPTRTPSPTPTPRPPTPTPTPLPQAF